MPSRRRFLRPGRALLLGVSVLVTACAGTTQVSLDDTFPVPVMEKTPLRLGILLDETLTGYTFSEKVDKRGEWAVDIGAVQEGLFTNLATGMVQQFDMVDALTGHAMEGVLRPTITDMQFSLPAQTRSNFYEVWIRYEFELFDANGNLVSRWPLPAYGKANNKDYGGSSSGIRAAAIAACRDAMAFFAINFTREPAVNKWLAAGKPSQPPPPPPAPAPQGDGSGDGNGDGNRDGTENTSPDNTGDTGETGETSTASAPTQESAT